MDNSSAIVPLAPLVPPPALAVSEQLDVDDLSIIFKQIDKILKNQNKVPILKAKIELIHKSVLTSKQKIADLDKSKVSQLPTVKKRIQAIATQIGKEKEHLKILNDEEAVLKAELDTIAKEEGTQSKLLKKVQTIIQKKIDGFSLTSASSVTDLRQIFELENQIRTILALKQDVSSRTEYQKFYHQLHPFLKKAKQLLKQNPDQFVFQAAAAKGQALRAGVDALTVLSSTHPVVENSKVSNQEVFLRPQEGVVFKRSSAQAREEEDLATNLFTLFSVQPTVGAIDIRKLSSERYGIRPLSRDLVRAYSLKEVSPNFLEGIKKKLLPKEVLVVNRYVKMPSENNLELDNYQKIDGKHLYLRFSDEEPWKITTLIDLKKLYGKDQLPLTAQIGTRPEKAMVLAKHLGDNTPIFRALTYSPSLQVPPPMLYLTPSLNDPKAKAAYEHCEQFEWSYVNEKGVTRTTNFRNLHKKLLERKVHSPITPLPLKGSSSPSLPSEGEFNLACGVSWNVMSPGLMQLKGRVVSEFTDIQSKPFVENMVSVYDLQQHPLALGKVFKNLTSKSKADAALTGIVQVLDLHGVNVAVSPESTAEYERFKNVIFKLPSGSLSLKQLMLDYLNEKISPSTQIEFEENGQKTRALFKDLDALKKVLGGKWNIVYFDLDYSVAESNVMQIVITHTGEKLHLIPLRSALLELPWVFEPLSLETIQRIVSMIAQGSRVKDWIQKRDAPVNSRLSTEAQQILAQQLNPILSRYNLSDPRAQGKTITLKDLQRAFTKEICDISRGSSLAIWKGIEKDLSRVVVREGDTVEMLAKRYHQEVGEILRLNPSIKLEKGAKINIHYDVTSLSKEAAKRRQIIAPQFFPRMTQAQQKALFERLEALEEYFSNYKTLSHSTLKGKELVEQIKHFVNHPTTPLFPIDRAEILRTLEKRGEALATPALADQLQIIQTSVLLQSKPTHMGLLMTMYPSLGLAYSLNLKVDKDPAKAGENIGLYSVPLEETIKQALTSQDPETQLLAKALQKEIADVSDPSFLAHVD